MNQTSFYCPQCHQMKLFQQQTMNNTPHILASVFLCGLWLPIWLLTALTYNPPWHCSFCGFSDRVRYLQNPGLREHEVRQAAERATRIAEIRRQRQIEREGSTPQGRIAYFISDNKAALIAVGLVTGGIGILGFVVMFIENKTRPAPVVVANSAIQDQRERVQIETRRTYARIMQEQQRNRYPAISFTTTGPKDDTLFVTSGPPDEKSMMDIRKNIDMAKLKEAGFTAVRFDFGKKQWTITP